MAFYSYTEPYADNQPLMTKLKNIFSIYVFVLISLSVLRLILFLTYQSDFATLDTNEVISAFFMGVRVDIISLCMIFSLPILLLFLPIKWIENRNIQLFIYALLFVLISFIVSVIITDIVYFEHVHRHIANEVKLIQNDTAILWDMAQVHFDKVIYFVIFEIILFFVFRKSINFNIDASFSLKNIGLLLLVIALFTLGIRNKITDKPFGIADAFTSHKTASGNLALNGFFSIAKGFNDKKSYHFLNKNLVEKNVRDALKSDEFKFISNKYPLLRQTNTTDDTQQKKYNVVIVLLESWSAKYVDSFSNNTFGVTPNFDKLANNGLKFTNFFANGQRSIEGVSTLFTGIPMLPEFNTLGSGLELSNLSYLGNSAKQAGYSTLSMQSSARGSFRLGAISKLAGFEQYYGAEDIPDLALETTKKTPSFGTWDNNMLSFYLDKINTLKAPFLSFAFTASTHAPFISPGKQWEKYQHDSNNILGYLNTLYYADDALGRFMEKAKKQTWFDDTIFIFTADHTVGFSSDKRLFKGTGIKTQKDRILEGMRIPLLIYAPKIFKQAKVIDRLSSQADIFPTLTHLLGWQTPIATLSNSVFSTSSQPFALFRNGNIMGYINENGYVKHNLTSTLENNLGETAKDILLSFYQFLSDHLKTNTIYPAHIQQNDITP